MASVIKSRTVPGKESVTVRYKTENGHLENDRQNHIVRILKAKPDKVIQIMIPDSDSR
jgi:hypothetical protein